MPETTPLIKAALNLRGGAGFDVYRNYEVKAVNTAIGSFLRKDINVQNENFQNLQDYILYLQTNVTGRRLRNTNFDTLRNIMRTEYPAEQVYF